MSIREGEAQVFQWPTDPAVFASVEGIIDAMAPPPVLPQEDKRSPEVRFADAKASDYLRLMGEL